MEFLNSMRLIDIIKRGLLMSHILLAYKESILRGFNICNISEGFNNTIKYRNKSLQTISRALQVILS
jgi:hypothetical protein